MRGLLCTLVLVVSLPGLNAWADQVTLTNGDRLTGTILELDAENLRLKTDMFGEVTIPRTAVAALTSDQDLAVTLPDEKVVVGTLASRDGQVEVRSATGEIQVGLNDLNAVRSQEEQAKYERSLHPSWYQNWELGVDTALSTRGGDGETRLTLGVDAARRTLNDEFTFNFLALYETEAGGTIVNDNKSRATAVYLHRLTQKTFYLGMGDFDHDALQSLKLRAVLAGGLGWRMKETERVTFDLIGGGALNSEYFQDEDVRRSGEAMLGEALRWQIAPRSYFEERVLVYPNLSRPGEYRVQLISTLDTRISSWLSWRLAAGTHYLSNPPPDTDKNDLLITSGLRFNIGQTPKNVMRLRGKQKVELRR